MEKYDCIIIGSGPAGLGAAFYLIKNRPELSILILDSGKTSSGGLRNDCKMNFTYPIGFPTDNWDKEDADYYLEMVIEKLEPAILDKNNLRTYQKRAEKLGVDLINIKQTHLGTDGGLLLIKKLIAELKELGVIIALEETMLTVDYTKNFITTDKREIGFKSLLIAASSGSPFLTGGETAPLDFKYKKYISLLNKLLLDLRYCLHLFLYHYDYRRNQNTLELVHMLVLKSYCRLPIIHFHLQNSPVSEQNLLF